VAVERWAPAAAADLRAECRQAAVAVAVAAVVMAVAAAVAAEAVVPAAEAAATGDKLPNNQMRGISRASPNGLLLIDFERGTHACGDRMHSLLDLRAGPSTISDDIPIALCEGHFASSFAAGAFAPRGR
jgi:hypothetical protein